MTLLKPLLKAIILMNMFTLSVIPGFFMVMVYWKHTGALWKRNEDAFISILGENNVL